MKTTNKKANHLTFVHKSFTQEAWLNSPYHSAQIHVQITEVDHQGDSPLDQDFLDWLEQIIKDYPELNQNHLLEVRLAMDYRRTLSNPEAELHTIRWEFNLRISGDKFPEGIRVNNNPVVNLIRSFKDDTENWEDFKIHASETKLPNKDQDRLVKVTCFQNVNPNIA